MTPYILAGTLIAGIFIGGLVVAWYFLVSCILKGGIEAEEKTCENCRYSALKSLDMPCYECPENYDSCWEPK